jgi:hypothetical protein
MVDVNLYWRLLLTNVYLDCLRQVCLPGRRRRRVQGACVGRPEFGGRGGPRLVQVEPVGRVTGVHGGAVRWRGRGIWQPRLLRLARAVGIGFDRFLGFWREISTGWSAVGGRQLLRRIALKIKTSLKVPIRLFAMLAFKIFSIVLTSWLIIGYFDHLYLLLMCSKCILELQIFFGGEGDRVVHRLSFAQLKQVY